MKGTIRIVTILAVIAATALAMPGHVLAMHGDDFAGAQTSVFPQPRDPWRSWGVRSELPSHSTPHFYRHDGFVHQQPTQVWMPGHWAWNGATWVWWPGHWGFVR